MIILNDREMKVAQFVLKRRTEISAQAGAVDNMVSDDPAKNLQGMYGEMAYGKLHNMYFDMSCSFQQYDFIDFLGNKIDVKSALPGMNLVVPENQGSHDVDIYALMLGQDDRWEYAGWTHKADIINDDHWKTNMPQPCWFMYVDDSRFRRTE